MPQLKRGILTSVLGSAGEGIRQAVRGVVFLGDSSVEAYVKEVDSREILIECICALLARQLWLDAPEPVLVYVPAAISRSGGDVLAYGSVSVSHGNLRPWLTQLGDTAVVRRLREWSNLIPAACFDEWIANHDRHGGNILYDGKETFWLIDHGLAIAASVAANDAVANVLFGLATEGLNETDLMTLKPKALGVMDDYTERPLQPVMADIPAGIWPDASLLAVSGWLSSRQAHLVRLADARVPTRQGSLPLGGGNGH